MDGSAEAKVSIRAVCKEVKPSLQTLSVIAAVVLGPHWETLTLPRTRRVLPRAAEPSIRPR